MKISFSAVVLLLVLSFSSCRWDKLEEQTPDTSCYPADVSQIITTTCAVSGCHNNKSYEAAGGLDLTNWETLFKGGNNSAAVIPYRPDQSPMMFFINTDSTMGPALVPTMPFDRTPLSTEQVATIREWILQGAPNCEGFVKFSDNPNRVKLYIPNQGCDIVAVIDLDSRLIMRYFDAGATSASEAPHNIKISPDGQYWYVCFANEGTVLQKFRTSDDSFVAEAVIGAGKWNTFAITSDSKRAFVVNFNGSGSIAVVNLETMTLTNQYEGSFSFPHGSALKDDTTLYVTANLGNFIYKLNVSDIEDPDISMVTLQPGVPPSTAPKNNPHEVAFSPDKSEYAVTCEKTNELRFFDASNDSLIATVTTGVFPQEIAFSATTDYVFVSCMDDDVTFPGTIGSVTVIDYKTHSFVKHVNAGFQPHGIAVDDESGQVFVACRNVNPNGPAPHHTTACGGRNGYLTIIDLNTRELVPGYRVELSADPYFIAVRR